MKNNLRRLSDEEADQALLEYAKENPSATEFLENNRKYLEELEQEVRSFSGGARTSRSPASPTMQPVPTPSTSRGKSSQPPGSNGPITGKHAHKRAA